MFEWLNFVELDRRMLRLLNTFCGFPKSAWTRHKNKVILDHLPEDELQFYNRIKPSIRRSQIVCVLVWSAWILKNSVYPIYMITALLTFKQFDAQDPIANLTFARRTKNKISTFGCLITDCEQLDNSNAFFKDIKQLPLFAICHPRLNNFYLPISGYNSIGLGLYTVVIYAIFFVGVVFPIINHLNPRIPDSAAFAAAPVSSITCHRETARKYLIEALASMKNYYSFFCRRDELAILRNIKRRNLIIELKQTEEYTHDDPKMHYVKAEKDSLDLLLRSHYVTLNAKVQDYIGGCVPPARCYNRSIRAAEFLGTAWISMYAMALLSYSACIVFFISLEGEISEELKRIDRFADATGCGFWIQQAFGDREHLVGITLGERVKHNNWVFAFDYLFLLLPTLITMSGNLVVMLIGIIDVNLMLRDQLQSISVATETAQLLVIARLHNCKTEGVDIASGSSGKLLEVPGAIHAMVVAEDSAKQVQCMDQFVDMLIKINIRTRIIKDMARKLSPSVTFTLRLAYVANYTSAAIMAGFDRLSNNSGLAPVLLALIGFSVSNSLILLTSRVQSTTNRLNHSMWRLIAATDDITDLRVRHIRKLIIRQANVIANEQTLKIIVFGLPVTYASLFEIVIWSSTLAIFTFNK